jgi:predicted permease
VPALWAAVFAVAMNLGGAPLPRLVMQALNMMSGAVAPLMLIVLGLSLRWESLSRDYARPIALVAAIQLVAMPAVVWFVAGQVGLTGNFRIATILEAAMPSMVLGLVICDRYGLDTNFYGAAVTITTLLSFATLPIWFAVA